MKDDNGGRAVHRANGAPGLRERKKLATRQALSAAAIRLALEQGFDNVRVEDIAEAAGVSPRTFNNYFSSREEAIVAARVAQVERMAQALTARPAEESLLEALGHAMTTEQDQPREPARDVMRLFICNPTLHAEFLRSTGQTRSPMIEAVAQRTGTSPDDLLPQVVTSAALGALRAAMAKWLNDEGSPPFRELVRDALNQLRTLAGNPEAAAPESAARGDSATTRAASRIPASAEAVTDSDTTATADVRVDGTADVRVNRTVDSVAEPVVDSATYVAASSAVSSALGATADPALGTAVGSAVDPTAATADAADSAVGDSRPMRRRLAASSTLSAPRQPGGPSSTAE